MNNAKDFDFKESMSQLGFDSLLSVFRQFFYIDFVHITLSAVLATPISLIEWFQ